MKSSRQGEMETTSTMSSNVVNTNHSGSTIWNATSKLSMIGMTLSIIAASISLPATTNAFTPSTFSRTSKATTSFTSGYEEQVRSDTSSPFSSQAYSQRHKDTRLFIGGRPNGANRDFYKILGVDRSADVATIKSAYRKLAKQYHPDANKGTDTTEKFQEVNRAYEVLSDESLRAKYDRFGEAGIGTSAASDSAAAGSPFGGAYGGGFGQEVDLGDIFDTFFGGAGGARAGAGPRARRGPIQGDDLRFDLEVDFKTGVFGGEEKVRIRHLETCGTCKGDGVKPGSAVNTCRVCNGQGVTLQVTRTPLGNFQTQQTCANCRGTGKKIEEYCGTCSGQGRVQKTKQIKVTIPAGVEDGNKLRVRNEGDAGPNGGPAGDLYIFLRVKEDRQFRREGPEIYSDATISYIDAIAGASIQVPVVDGDVTIKVPKGTQPGQVMRLKGNGAPRLGNPNQRGDHYVTMNVEIPKDLSSEEEDLIQQLKALQEKKSGKETTSEKKGIFQ